MFPMSALLAEEALRLANERFDGLREESRVNRIPSAAKPSRVARIRTSVLALVASAREVEVGATPRLVEYPYRT